MSVELSGAGLHFQQGVTTADFGTGITVTAVTVTSPITATATLNIDPSAPSGDHDIIVHTLHEAASMAYTLRLTDPASVSGFQVSDGRGGLLRTANPASAMQGDQGVSVQLSGSGLHFQQGVTTADFGTGITVTALTVTSPSTATATLNIDPSATPGAHDVSVRTLGEGASMSATLHLLGSGISFFEVDQLPTAVPLSTPTIRKLSVIRQVAPAGTQNMTISLPTPFLPGITTVDFGAGITVNAATASTSRNAVADISISPTAATCSHTATVTTANTFATGSFRVDP